MKAALLATLCLMLSVGFTVSLAMYLQHAWRMRRGVLSPWWFTEHVVTSFALSAGCWLLAAWKLSELVGK